MRLSAAIFGLGALEKCKIRSPSSQQVSLNKSYEE
jgi:hypothetical protein